MIVTKLKLANKCFAPPLASKTPSRFVEPVRGLGRLSTQKKSPASVMRRIIFGGEGGIRTLDTLPYTHFPGVRLRPLGHRSVIGGLASDGRGLQARNAPKTINHQGEGKSGDFFGLFSRFYQAELHQFPPCVLRECPRKAEHRSGRQAYQYAPDEYALPHAAV